MRPLVMILFGALAGCSTARYLIPNTVTPQLTHESHILQHEPFTSHPTDYGADIAELEMRWNVRHFTLAVSDGVILNHCYSQIPSCGEIIGRNRETFRATIGYSFETRR